MCRGKSSPAQQTAGQIKKDRNALWALAVFFILANGFTAYFISQEKYIYYWDFITYWNKVIYLCDHFFGDTAEVIKTVFYSIREDKYNYFPALLLMPFGLLFGTSRMVYILSIVNVFAVPVVASFIVLHKRLTQAQGLGSPLLCLIPVFLILLSPDFWNPILFGFVDVGGIFVINIILLLYLKNSFEKQKIRDLLLIAGLIPLLVIFRRWYAFWGISFYVVLLMDIGITACCNRPFEIKKCVQSLLKYATQVAISTAIFFLAVPTYGQKMVKTNYIDLQSAYRSGDLFQSFEIVLNSFGLLYFSLFILGAVGAAMDKRTRKFTLFMLTQFFIIFVMFARTQDFNSHHRYLLLPPVILFASFLISRFVCSAIKFKPIVLGVLVVLFVLNFLTAFGAEGIGGKKKTYPTLFTDIRHRPLFRNDLKEMERLLSTLQEQLTKEDRVYVLASSDILNSNILISAYLFFGRFQEVGWKILKTHDIDKRHGFPQSLLTAQYVLTTDPIEYHMDPSDQRVVGVPAGLFIQQKGIATSFEKLPYEFTLGSNVKVYIYRKIRPISEADARDLSETLRGYYPDHEIVYKIKEK